MSETEILAAFRQLSAAIAKRDRLDADAKRLGIEHAEACRLASEATAYIARCENHLKELAKRGSVVVPLVEEKPKAAATVERSNAGQVQTLKPAKVKG